MESTLTEKGQATIPKVVRDRLKLKHGDKVKFFFHPDGSVVILPKLPATALRGMLSSKRKGKKAPTIEEMDAAVAEGVVNRYLRAVEP